MPHAHASGFPSPCNDRGGQAPALRCPKAILFTVGLGPSDATRACERVSLAMQRSRRPGPRATKKNATLTVGRGPVPRHAFGGQTSSPL